MAAEQGTGGGPKIVKPPRPTITDRLNRAADQFYNYLAPRVVEPIEQAAQGNWGPLQGRLSPLVSPAVGQVPVNTPVGQAPLWKYIGVRAGQALFDWLYPRTAGSAAFASQGIPGAAALGRAAPFVGAVFTGRAIGGQVVKEQRAAFQRLQSKGYNVGPSSKWRYMRAYD